MTITVTLTAQNEILPQPDWSEFYWSVTQTVLEHKHDEGFYHEGASDGSKPWQTAAWVFDVPTGGVAALRKDLLTITRQFNLPITLTASSIPETIHTNLDVPFRDFFAGGQGYYVGLSGQKPLPDPEDYMRSRGG